MANSPGKMQVIAERVLNARSRTSDTQLVFKAVIGAPYWTTEGVEAACPIALEGLHGRLADICGIDPMDALRNALGVLEKSLTGALEDYELYWPDGEAFEPASQ